MQKVLVTGGAGYIGSHTVVELISAGLLPVIIDNFSNSEPWILDRVEEITAVKPALYIGDCSDADFVDSVFKTEKSITSVIHFAGFKAVGESVQNPLKYYKNNVGSTVAVLEAMARNSVTRFVFSSSATVYGEPDTNPILETAPRKQALSPYGATKAMCEDIVEDDAKSSSLKAVSLRYFNPIGAHTSGKIGELPKGVPNNLVPFITQTVAGIREKLTIFGTDYNTPDGSCIRDFIHVVDLARAHIAALRFLETKDTSFYDVFNVGTGKGTSVLELIRSFENINQVTVPHVIGARREGDIAEYYADPSKISMFMGWASEYSIETCLQDSWHWQCALASSHA
jgi:UDP-glucose 4-epimerase